MCGSKSGLSLASLSLYIASISLSPSKFDSVHALRLMCTSTNPCFLFQAARHVYADNFFLSSFHEKCQNVPTQHNVMSLCCSRELFWSSLTHLEHVPKKPDVRMHNPEKHSHAHCLSFEKKKNNIMERWWTQSIYLAKKKKIEKETRKTKKEEIWTNLLYQQIKIKEKIEQVCLWKLYSKKKKKNNQSWANPFWKNASLAKLSNMGSSSSHSRTLQTPGLSLTSWRYRKFTKHPSGPIEEPLTALLLFSFLTNSQSYG